MAWNDMAARKLSTRDLRIFLAVVQTGSMAKAAKTLATSQPAISKAVADMEQSLGVRLLDRSRKGVEPNAYGLVVVKCGIAVFDELKQRIDEIAFLTDPTAGDLRIGCPDPVAAGLVRTIIDRLLQKHPRMRFCIVTESLNQQLRDRNVELVINRISDEVVEDDFDVETLYHDTIRVVAGASNPLVRRRKLRLADVAHERWVFAKPEGPLWSYVVKAFQAQGLNAPRAAVTTNSYHMRYSLLTTGRFLSVRANLSLEFQYRQPMLKALPIELPTTLAPVAILTLKNRTLTPVARLFIEHARETAKPLQKKRDT